MHYFRSTWTSVISTWNIHRKLALPYGINPWHRNLEFHNLGRGAIDIIVMHLFVLKYVWKQSKTFYKIWYIFTKWLYWLVQGPEPLIQDDTFHTLRRLLHGYHKHAFSFIFHHILMGVKKISLDVIHCYYITIMAPAYGLNSLTKGSWFYHLSKQHYREDIYAFSFSKIFIL